MHTYTVTMGRNVEHVEAHNVRDAAEKAYGVGWNGPDAMGARYIGVDAADVTMSDGSIVRAVAL